MSKLSFQKKAGAVFARIKQGITRINSINHAGTLSNYLTLFARDFSSLFIQTFYFLLLANTLSLADMGVFAATLSIGMIIGSTIGLGYEELSYRMAIQRPRLIGHFLAGTYFAVLLTLPVGLVVSALLYIWVLSDKITLLSFLEVMIVELLLWRLIEIFALLNEGLGHFSKIVKGFVLAYAIRASAALLFWYSAYNDLTSWIHLYFIANSLAFACVWLLFRPKARLRLNIPMVLSRLGHSSYMSFTKLMHSLQREVDKVVILLLAGSEATGIYTISMRVLALVAMPVQAFFNLYMRKLLQKRETVNILRNNLMVEGVIFAVVTIGFLILMQILHIVPNLLGKNVASASFFYSGLLFIPALKTLLEFHSELYFAFNHIKDRALSSVMISVLKTGAMVLVIMLSGSIDQWMPWMNLSYVLLYLVSLGLVYPVITERFSNIPALLWSIVPKIFFLKGS